MFDCIIKLDLITHTYMCNCRCTHATHTHTHTHTLRTLSKHCCKQQNLMILRMLWWPDSTRRTLNCIGKLPDIGHKSTLVVSSLPISSCPPLACLLLPYLHNLSSFALALFNFIYHSVCYFYSPSFSSYSLSLPSLHTFISAPKNSKLDNEFEDKLQQLLTMGISEVWS